MIIWLDLYILVALFALVISLVLTIIFRQIALSISFVDKPSIQNHKKHAKPIPLMGGVALCLSWTITIIAGFLAVAYSSLPYIPTTIISELTSMSQLKERIIAIIVGGILITLLGLIDDKHPMSAKVKFVGQFIIVAGIVSMSDIRISLFVNSSILGWILAVLWILIIINSVNFFDNMDGLAVGTSAIAFLFFALIGLLLKHYFVASLASAGLGACIGFWFFNFNPASIFMGDAGSHFLGYILGITGALSTFYKPGTTSTHLAVLVPLFILAIPLYDMASVSIIRMKAGKPIYVGDHNHISHRFCKMGMSKKSAVACVHILAVVIGLSVLPMIWGDYRTAIICLVQGCIILLLISRLQCAGKETK